MAKRNAPKRATSGSVKLAGRRGLHPVFGPIADPGPGDLGGGWGGWGGWHGGPVADPGPGFGGWRGSLFGAIDRNVLDAAAQKQITALRVRRIGIVATALEQQAAVMDEEFKLLSRLADRLQIDKAQLPPWVDPGDPVPELRPVDFLRYVYELRTAVLQRTIAYVKDSMKAVEGAR